MPGITNFTEAQQALSAFYGNAQAPFTLEPMQKLMAFLGNPQDAVKVIHIAGTSGKTSTAYYAAGLLHNLGGKVGLSVSPHVDNLNERVRVNGLPLPEAEFCAELEEFLKIIAGCDVLPTYFVAITAFAYWQFARRGLEYAVMEVGLGGRLDATNVVRRADKVCVITDIGLDHTEMLGDTLGKIAAEKAGIIGDGNMVFMYRQGDEVMASVQKAVKTHDAHLVTIDDADAIGYDFLPLFQQRNLALAARAVNYVSERDGRSLLTDAQLQQTAHLTVPARLERLTLNDKLLILDGSHNQQKIEALLASVHTMYPGQHIAMLAGFVDGDNQRWQGGLQALLPAAQHIIFTAFESAKDYPKTSVSPWDLADYCRHNNFTNVEVVDQPAKAFEALKQRPEPILLVTGSFYLMNHIRPLVKGQA